MSKYLCFLFNRKSATHNGEIQQLYEEMEQQLKNEKDRLSHKVQFLFVIIIGKGYFMLFTCFISFLFVLICTFFKTGDPNYLQDFRSQDLQQQLSSKEQELEWLFLKQRRVSAAEANLDMTCPTEVA